MRFKNVAIRVFFSVIFTLIINNISYAEIIKFSNCKFINYDAGKRLDELFNEAVGKKVVYNKKEALQKKNSRYEYINITFNTESNIFTYEIKRKKRDKKKVIRDNFEFLDKTTISFLHLNDWEVKNPSTGKVEYKGLSYDLYVIDLSNSTIAQYNYVDDQKNLHSIKKCKSNYSISGENEDVSASSGTAFFISNKGHLLTNSHVVEGCTLSKISYKNKDYDAKLIATDKTLDLALLKVELKPKSFFTFSKNGAKKLNKVYVAGYPLGKGLSDDLKISSGIVSSLKGFEDNSNEIQIDAPINPGNSGGPIINENGDLIAIAVSGLAKDLTEGINFGIKSSAAETFLRSNKINPKKSMYAGIKDNDKLLAILEEGTVYTYCD
ncbi:MAG: S1C family serine protease [Candidatus Pelagibacter sp.]